MISDGEQTDDVFEQIRSDLEPTESIDPERVTIQAGILASTGGKNKPIIPGAEKFIELPIRELNRVDNVSNEGSFKPGIGSVIYVEGGASLHLLKELGSGGFGCVYLANFVSEESSEEVAVKFFHCPEPETATQLANREIIALEALDSKFIPKVKITRVAPDFACYVTSYYSGGSLADWIKAKRLADERVAWRFLEQLMTALRDAHAKSILHLDVKPANILLDGDDFYLCDFGISQASLLEHNTRGCGLGTPGYRAPEQILIKPELFNMTTDIFSAGLTLWYMLTSIEPTNSFVKYINRAVADGNPHPLPSCSIHREDLSPSLIKIINKMLSLKQSSRPSCAADILEYIKDNKSNGSSKRKVIATPTKIPTPEKRRILSQLSDAIIQDHLSKFGSEYEWLSYGAEDIIAAYGDASYSAFILLAGEIAIERDNNLITIERREGTILGETSTLIFTPRTASMRAISDVVIVQFDAIAMEKFITQSPPLTLRIMRSLATRLHRESCSQ